MTASTGHRGSPGRERQTRSGRASGRAGDRVMVPEADFSSYYGRPVVKPAPWEHDIAYYLFTGGLLALGLRASTPTPRT